MSFTNQTKKNTYSGDGVTAAFAFSFPILTATDLLVQIKDTNGTVTSKTITTHYTVSGTGNRTGFTDYTSGTVTFTAGNIPASTDTIIIKRNVSATQETDYTEKGAFPAETHERALDKLTMLHLQQQEDLDRSIKTDSAVSGFDGTLPTPVANKFIKIDSAGTGLELSDDTSVIGALSKADGTFYVGDGTTIVAESGSTARDSLNLGTSDSPQFTGIEVGHATDTTVTRASAGDLNVEGNIIYRAGGTDVPVTDGGTGASTAAGARTNLGLGTGDNVTFTDVTATGNIAVTGTVDGRDVATDGTKLDGIEAAADVTDETNVKAALDGATISSATVATGDKVLIQDVDDSNNLKTVTTQSIADLAYEEGTWTPNIDSATPGSGRVTVIDYAYYSVVGDTVTVYAYIRLNTLGTGGSGEVQISGLPYSADSSANRFFPVHVAWWSGLNASLVHLGGLINPGTSYIDLRGATAATAAVGSALSFSTVMTTGSSLIFSATYKKA